MVINTDTHIHTTPTDTHTLEPVYYGHLGTNQKCPGYQDVLILQVILYDKELNLN